MKIYKLSYPTKEDAINDFKAKGILVDTTMGVTSIYGVDIVELGILYRDEIELDGYHFDIISIEDLDFETITPNTPLHSFSGWQEK